MLKKIVAVFKAYDFRDVVLSILAIVAILAMILKMMLFPYGFFNFGQPNIYTEGLISRNGFQNINPLFVDYNEADREVSSLVFSGLMKYDPEKRAVVDDMGVLTINEDKTEYSFALREGIKWHDGEPLTVEDVYFTFHDIIMDPSFPNEILKTNFAGVKVEVLGERKVKFILEKPNIFFIANLTTGVLPKHILEKVEPYEILQNEYNKMPVGSGPYMMAEAVEAFADGGMQVTLASNPYFYGAKSDIEVLRFLSFPSMDKLIEEISSLNGVVKITGNHILSFKNMDRFELIPYELPQYTAVFMNMESKMLKDNKNIRLALQKAIDKEALIAQFEDKIPVDTPLMELNQDEWVYQPSLEQAEGALKESGYNYADEDTEKAGIRYNDDGDALELSFIARLYDEGSDQYAETLKVVSFLQESWEGVGFSIKVELLPDEMFKERIMSRSYDLLFVGQSLGYNLDTYSYWHSTQADPLGQNLSNYKSFAVDSLIEDVRFVFNQEKREKLLMNLAEQIKEDIPAVFLYRPLYHYATDGKVAGISMDGVVFPSDRFAGISQWSFE